MSGWPDGLTSAELLACLVAEHPAFRSGAELDRISPAELLAGERIDLLGVLEEQRRWFEAAQVRMLAAIQADDESGLGLGQEGVSLALQIPVRTAQARLAQADTLVRELPRTLAAVAAGSISAAHATVLAEAVWRLPADPARVARRAGGGGAAAGAGRSLRHRAAAQAAGPAGRAGAGSLDGRATASAGGGGTAGGIPPG
jgi:hypothetical protein